MNSIRIRKQIDSEILTLPELRSTSRLSPCPSSGRSLARRWNLRSSRQWNQQLFSEVPLPEVPNGRKSWLPLKISMSTTIKHW